MSRWYWKKGCLTSVLVYEHMYDAMYKKDNSAFICSTKKFQCSQHIFGILIKKTKKNNMRLRNGSSSIWISNEYIYTHTRIYMMQYIRIGTATSKTDAT